MFRSTILRGVLVAAQLWSSLCTLHAQAFTVRQIQCQSEPWELLEDAVLFVSSGFLPYMLLFTWLDVLVGVNLFELSIVLET